MKRGNLAKLNAERWEKLFDQSDIEVCLVPSGMPDLTTSKLLGVTSESLDQQVCGQAFVNFRNYTEDDGTPVENTLANRLELYRTPILRRAINNTLENLNAELILGEDDAASD